MIPEYVARLRRAVGPDELLWLPGVNAVVLDGAGRVLLQRSRDTLRWSVISGILDPGEDPATGVRREVLEETAVTVHVERLTSVTVSPPVRHANGDHAQYLELTFRCAYLHGEARVNDDESAEVGWFPAYDLPEMDDRTAAKIRQATSDDLIPWVGGGAPVAGPRVVPTEGPCVTVVTATRRRPELLPRVLESVSRQVGGHVAAHLILADDCAATMAALAEGAGTAEVHHVPRRPGQESGPERLAELRDLGAKLADTPWIAYLDDDNEWEPDHLRRLLETARASGAEAVHSWRRMVAPDGSPYTAEVFPWGRDQEIRRAEYRKRVGMGVIDPGGAVYRDSVATEVDSGEWLLTTDLVRRTGFAFVLTEEDRHDRIGEDDVFLAKLKAAQVAVACSEQPTLIYWLGGDSNLRLRAK